MRRLCALALLLVALSPLAGATDVAGSSYGVNGGYVDVGLWRLYEIDHPGGVLDLQLSWSLGLFPCGAKYDLYLYPPGSLDDGVLNERPLAISEDHACNHHFQELLLSEPAARYVIAVVPWQAEGEVYQLHASAGNFYVVSPPAPGTIITCPIVNGPCPTN